MGDDTCVTVDQRALALVDNAAAAARRNPARLVFGPNACAEGFVWRSADQTDYVCVPPAARSRAAADNAAAASRWVEGDRGPHTCVTGFVWRASFAGDDVCVTVGQRNQVAADNGAGPSHVQRPAG